MKNITRTTYNFWLIASSIFILSILLQSNIFCNTDANWLLHATAKLLHGEKYYYNFFETNPPMILYINIIPVLLAKLLHLPMSLVFRIYVFFIAFFSTIFCAILLRQIYKFYPAWVRCTFVLAIIFVFVLLPTHAFGEREHLALMLVAPYVFLIILRVRNLHVSLIFTFKFCILRIKFKIIKSALRKY